jgi:hypothetical protein
MSEIIVKDHISCGSFIMITFEIAVKLSEHSLSKELGGS